MGSAGQGGSAPAACGRPPGSIFAKKKPGAGKGAVVTALDQRFAGAMGQLLGPDFPDEVALAVSGGGDSMAMLTLAHNWTRVWGVRLRVVTVDHGLRPEAAAEAALVAETCAELGWPHDTLHWRWDGQGNVMDAARRGRLEAIDAWRGGVRDVLLAHTRDDVAETFLMRLRRGSGVEGLSAMQAVRAGPGRGAMRIVRPCLGMGREELRHYLRTLRGGWVEDPTNEDPRYERARIRRLRGLLAEEGMDTGALAGTAQRMARAREALRARAAQVWGEIGQEVRAAGDVLIDRDGFAGIERDTQLRILAGALQYVASAAYRPRAEPLEALLDRLLAGGGGTLHGCETRAEKARLRVFRELSALGPSPADAGTWDGRWRIAPPEPGLTVAPLDEAGWRQVSERAEGALPFHAARSLPALWRGVTLVACDALGVGPGATATLAPLRADSLRGFLLSH